MPETTDATAPTGATGAEGAGNTGSTEAKSVADLPKWAQDELSRARSEAASYRTSLRDTEKAKEALQKQYDDEAAKVNGLTTDLSDAKLFSLKLDAALEVGVPGEHLKTFADRLRGESLEELKKDAETIKTTFGVGATPTGRATDRSAGLGNDKPSTPDEALGTFIGSKLGWK